MVIIYDIETSNVGGVDANTNRLKVLAYYNTETGEFAVLREHDKDRIKEITESFDVKVGFNNKAYDDVILRREGYRINGTIIDMYQIIKHREPIMKYKFKSKNLKNICKVLGLDTKSDDIDYSWLNSEETINENWEKIKKYIKQDIKITTELWEFLVDYFYPFGNEQLLNRNDIKNFKHISLSPSAYAYKVICNLANLKEEYLDVFSKVNYEGGYVSKPLKELVKGKIYCMDFNSAYTMGAYTQANLFEHKCLCCSEEEKYKGGKLFKLNGSYCTKKNGIIEKSLMMLYDTRQELKKKKDNKEYAYKVLLNVFYGICGNPSFKSVFNINTASDCTLMVRTMIKHARKRFGDAGYEIIYSDTDSVYLVDVYDNEALLMKVKDDLIKEIKDSVPFPNSRFDMGIDDRIKLMYFPGLKKKNYLYVTEDDRLVVKGLPIIKSNASSIGKHVFNTFLKNKILREGVVRVSKESLKENVFTALQNDITLAVVEWKTKKPEYYKLNSQIQAQISEKYGQGTHYLIPNNKGVGVGKGKSYCTIEEFRKNNLTIDDVDLSKVYSELQPFCEEKIEQQTTKIIKRRKNKVLRVNNVLERWIK
jgi:DNA polymerase elongation subunit (family B)